MKIKFLLYIGIIIFSLFTKDSALAQSEKHYINGIDANYPPFAFIDESGNPSGFDVESMNWIANKLGFTVEHRPIDWDGIIPALLAKKIDMICAGMSISPEREQNVLFTTPYWETQKVLIVLQHNELTPDELFYGKDFVIGVQAGTNEAELLQQEKIHKNYTYKLRFYTSAPLAIEDLLNKRISAIVMDELPANDAIAHKKPIKKLSLVNKTDSFGVAVRKEDVLLAELIEKGYRLLKADPFWQTLKQKYLGTTCIE